MAIIKAGQGYSGGDFRIETGDQPFDSEFEQMLRVSKEELIASIIGEGVVDKLWKRIQKIRSQKHEQMMSRIDAESSA